MNLSDRQRLQEHFLKEIAEDSHFQVLFEHLPRVSFFAKDSEGRIMRANRTFRDRLELEEEEDIIGLSDFDLFPKGLADNFRRDDLKVMQTGKPMLNLVELFLNREGKVDWYMTNKLPVFNRQGQAIGVMGTVQPYALAYRLSYPYPEIEKAVAYIRTHFKESLKMAYLARHVGLSVRHFDRKFKQALSISPKSFQIKTRIQAACETLRESSVNVGELASDLGFSDQSSFTLHFRKEMGITPLKYRQKYLSGH